MSGESKKKGPARRSNARGTAQKKKETEYVCSAEMQEALTWPTNRFVVNVRKTKPDFYVGRPNPRFPGSDCMDYKFGNPFKISKQCNRDDVCIKYKELLETDGELAQAAKTHLKGKTLGCWCFPLPCHAMMLAKVANEP